MTSETLRQIRRSWLDSARFNLRAARYSFRVGDPVSAIDALVRAAKAREFARAVFVGP